MCGITGFISRQQVSVNLLVEMNNLLKHRGPDDEGYLYFRKKACDPCILGGIDTPANAFRLDAAYAPKELVTEYVNDAGIAGFAHRRLSIVDLTPHGHQPMSSICGRYWIVFNGEIYNHAELRSELSAAGYRFQSSSDTEVILAAYSHWGNDALSRFNGMWAFAIYDHARETLFLSRDRFGVKPLYYCITEDGTLLFASEIKCFTVFPTWRSVLNGPRAYDYLVNGLMDHTDETLFEGVYQIPAGSFAQLDSHDLAKLKKGERVRPRQWYRPPSRPYAGSFEEAAREFRAILEKSVELRAVADVPVGSCLSGGLDSSAIVCLANNYLKCHNNGEVSQKTFSACSTQKQYDERKWIDLVVAHTQVEPDHIYPDLTTLFEQLSEIVWHQDEPFGSTSIYAQWSVFNLGKKAGIKIMLDGQGSDEQLAGYHDFFGPRLATLLRQGRFLSFLRELHAIRKTHGHSYPQMVIGLLPFLLPGKLQTSLKHLFQFSRNCPDWIDASLLGIGRSPLGHEATWKRNTVVEWSKSQIQHATLPMLLHWEDRNSMAHSIESRVPFLDYRLVEFSLGLPDEYKVQLGVTKRVLRSAMDGIIPPEVLARTDKLGFATPEEYWVKNLVPDEFRNRLSEAIDNGLGIFEKQKTMELFENIVSGRMRYRPLPWRIVNFSEWVKVFGVTLN